MKPFNGRCDMPELKVEDGVVTISEKRCRNSNTVDPVESEDESLKNTKKGKYKESFFYLSRHIYPGRKLQISHWFQALNY